VRILVAHSFYRVAGGEDLYVRQLVRLLGPGHDVRLFEARNEELTGNLAAAHRMIGSRDQRRRVERVLADFDPDVVHLNNAYPSLGPAVHLAARNKGVPLVMTVHNYRLRCPNGLMFTEGKPCRRCLGGNNANAVIHKCFPSRAQAAGYATALWVHRFVMRLERDVSLFITPSDYMHSELESWGIERDRLVTIRNFTDIAAPERPAPGGYGLYVGRLSSEKGLGVLFRALRRLGDPEFLIAGTGPHEEALRREAAAAGLTRTTFLGRVDRKRVADLLASARYLAIPSTWEENAPLAALEALTFGVPLVVTDKGGLPELVSGGAGVVCPAGDEVGLADAIRRVATGGRDYDAMSARARDVALSQLTPQAHREALEQAYSRLVG
jgi:glycosyltransferase involved in cell wall biosynthesis